MQLRLLMLVSVGLCVSGFGSCWLAPFDSFVGAEPNSAAAIHVFVDQNSNGIREKGEPPLANAQVLAELVLLDARGATVVDSRILTSDASGLVKYDYNPTALTSGLYQLQVSGIDKSTPSAKIFRQIDIVLPFRSMETPIGSERYCVAYEGPEAIRRIEERFGQGADLASLGAWRSLAYQIAAPEFVLAASQAALQRTLGGNARVEFFPGDDPAYVLGESIPQKPGTSTCESNANCPQGQICYRNPDDDGRYCMKASPCAASSIQKGVILAATFGSGSSPPVLCGLSVNYGRKGSAVLDVRNFNGMSSHANKALVYVNSVTTFQRPNFPRSAADTIEDLGRQIGRMGAHEAGHTLGLTAALNLSGSTRSAQSADLTLSNNEANHPDTLNPLINRFRVPSRSIMLSGYAPWVVSPRILVDAELDLLQSCSVPFSPIRVPAAYSNVEAEYLYQATPNLNL
jgi:hypothetical protein